VNPGEKVLLAVRLRLPGGAASQAELNAAALELLSGLFVYAHELPRSGIEFEVHVTSGAIMFRSDNEPLLRALAERAVAEELEITLGPAVAVFASASPARLNGFIRLIRHRTLAQLYVMLAADGRSPAEKAAVRDELERRAREEQPVT
jgi:hypothetical protein